jgi:hypothetical protein
MTSPLSAHTLSDLLDTIPEQPLLEETEPVLLTCPHCSFITTSTATSLACTRCLRRFKRNEHMERGNVDQLTTFPSLLEEHGVLRERERERRNVEGGDGGGYVGGSLGRMFSAVWGGGGGSTVGRRDSVMEEDDEESGGAALGLSSRLSR